MRSFKEEIYHEETERISKFFEQLGDGCLIKSESGLTLVYIDPVGIPLETWIARRRPQKGELPFAYWARARFYVLANPQEESMASPRHPLSYAKLETEVNMKVGSIIELGYREFVRMVDLFTKGSFKIIHTNEKIYINDSQKKTAKKI